MGLRTKRVWCRHRIILRKLGETRESITNSIIWISELPIAYSISGQPKQWKSPEIDLKGGLPEVTMFLLIKSTRYGPEDRQQKDSITRPIKLNLKFSKFYTADCLLRRRLLCKVASLKNHDMVG